MRDVVRAVIYEPQPGLPLDSEWERVALTLCRRLWAGWSSKFDALSAAVQVSGDGRPDAFVWEPDPHGATCTMGSDAPFAPVAYRNRIPALGPA